MPANKQIIVGVDLGGTSLRALVVDAENRTLADVKTPTLAAAKPDTLIREIARTVDQAVKAAGLARRAIAAVSIGAPGSTDPETGMVHRAPNLGWLEVPLGKKLKDLLRVPVLVGNDVNVGALGEYVLGAGRGTEDMVGIFVGTGIGGAILTHGKLYHGSRGGAGEIGHTVIMVDGPLCSCGHRGCAEALASRTAMERDVRAAIKAGNKSMVLKIMKLQNRPRMTSSVIARALRKGDPVMRQVFERAQYYLGILVANAVNLLDPECVVIGGGIADRLGETFVAPIRRAAYPYFLRAQDAERVTIVPGSLGDNAGALGAIVAARQWLRQ
jgi:glucokinase